MKQKMHIVRRRKVCEIRCSSMQRVTRMRTAQQTVS